MCLSISHLDFLRGFLLGVSGGFVGLAVPVLIVRIFIIVAVLLRVLKERNITRTVSEWKWEREEKKKKSIIKKHDS